MILSLLQWPEHIHVSYKHISQAISLLTIGGLFAMLKRNVSRALLFGSDIRMVGIVQKRL